MGLGPLFAVESRPKSFGIMEGEADEGPALFRVVIVEDGARDRDHARAVGQVEGVSRYRSG
jgi:hypothetical protein